MTDNVVENYGWSSASGPQSCGYIAPRILTVLKGLDAKRVLDLGAGNGALCTYLAKHNIQMVGVEYTSSPSWFSATSSNAAGVALKMEVCPASFVE